MAKKRNNGFMWYEPTTPRKVNGGIRAISRRGGFGSTWWGKEWVRILESSNIGGRLSRGKSYARKGQVTELTSSPGKITARVQGSQAGKYSITLECATLSEMQKEKLILALEEQPFLVARLLEKDLPLEGTETGGSFWAFPGKPFAIKNLPSSRAPSSGTGGFLGIDQPASCRRGGYQLGVSRHPSP